jgi:hypothetical protein
MYLERFGHTLLPGVAIQALAVGLDGAVWASDGAHLLLDTGGEWNVPGVTAILVRDDGLWLGRDGSIDRVVEGDVRTEQAVVGKVLRFVRGAATFALTATGLWRCDGGEWEAVAVPADTFVDAACMASGLCLASSTALYVSRGQTWEKHTVPAPGDTRRWASFHPPHDMAPADLRAVAGGADGHLWIGTSAGVLVFDGRDGWYAVRGSDGLPIEDITHLARADSGELWAGTPDGLCLYADGRWEYYAGRRWLPHNRVCSLVAEGRSALVGTEAGLARVERRPFTLEAKAELFEERIHQRHNRHGYVTVCFLEEPGNADTAIIEASDNDGLWTALYVAAECYRYAVTGSAHARDMARRSMDALLRLEEITPIEGFPARAILRKGERAVQSGGEWHPTPDGEGWWKGDTSSDEMDGHVYAFSVYHDLVADAPERQRIAATLGRIAGHILEHGFYLVDVDGEPTTWGVWAPERLNGDWKAQQGLNSLEILCCMKTAAHITGESRFEDAYRHLIREHHYALNTVEQKITLPGRVNHSDDELAFLSYYPLLKYETDPDLRRIYTMSLERSWEIERPERCPLWNFICAALTGRPRDFEAAIQTLREIPIDLVTWEMRNSHRADVRACAPPGGWTQELDPRILPPFERRVQKWNGNPFRLDGGDAGRGEEDGAFFLLPYWMGRYYGFLREDGSVTRRVV